MNVMFCVTIHSFFIVTSPTVLHARSLNLNRNHVPLLGKSKNDHVYRCLQEFGDKVSIAMARFSSFLLFLILFFVTNTFANEIYTNVWAVKIRGGRREVEKVALKHGFSYDKHVSTAQLQAHGYEGKFYLSVFSFSFKSYREADCNSVDNPN